MLNPNRRKLEPVRPYLACKSISFLFKMWRSYQLTETHCLKLFRLFIGFEFVHQMDAEGRYPLENFSFIRQRLKYRTGAEFLADVLRSQSFEVLGNNPKAPDFICSPVWYAEKAHPADEAAKTHAKIAAIVINNNNYSPEGTSGEDSVEKMELADMKRDQQDRQRVVKAYFQWVMQQSDGKYIELLKRLRQLIQYPGNARFGADPSRPLNEAECRQVLTVLCDQVFPSYFKNRERFFDERFMKNCDERFYWVHYLVKNYGNKFVLQALTLWSRKRTALSVQSNLRQEEEERKHRPLSPFEWMTPQGQRFYLDRHQQPHAIPADAAPRPAEGAEYNRIRQAWMLGGEVIQ